MIDCEVAAANSPLDRERPNPSILFSLSMKQVWLVVWFLALVVLLVPRGAGDSVDPRKPYGRVCLAVVSDSGVEAAFDTKTAYGPGDRLVAHSDATAPCIAVALALDSKTGYLANDWRPQAAELAEGQEAVLPQRSTLWNFTSSQPFDFYVLFLDLYSSDTQSIKRLIAAMQNTKGGSQLLSIQTTKLHELLTRQLAGSQLSSHVAAIPSTDEVGGMLRGGDEFPWRRFSVRVNFSETQPGMLVFSSGKLGE